MTTDLKPVWVTVPALLDLHTPVSVERWLKTAGSSVQRNEKLVILTDGDRQHTVNAPATGVLETISRYAREEVEVADQLGVLMVAPGDIPQEKRDWDNFDAFAEIVGEFVERSGSAAQMKSANEALGQVLGVEENATFQRMSVQQQNDFLKKIVDEHHAVGISPADMAQKLLEGLKLKPPQLAPASPAPVYGLRPSAPGLGTSGGGNRGYNNNEN